MPERTPWGFSTFGPHWQPLRVRPFASVSFVTVPPSDNYAASFDSEKISAHRDEETGRRCVGTGRPPVAGTKRCPVCGKTVKTSSGDSSFADRPIPLGGVVKEDSDSYNRLVESLRRQGVAEADIPARVMEEARKIRAGFADDAGGQGRPNKVCPFCKKSAPTYAPRTGEQGLRFDYHNDADGQECEGSAKRVGTRR